MRTTNHTTTNARTLAADAASDIADAARNALPTIAALAGIAALFLVPLFLLARSAGAL